MRLCSTSNGRPGSRAGGSLPAPHNPTALYGEPSTASASTSTTSPRWAANLLWLSPVHTSPSHHGYDHEDFLKVEPRYAATQR